MKKLIFSILLLLIAAIGVSCGSPTTEAKNTVPSVQSLAAVVSPCTNAPTVIRSVSDDEMEPVSLTTKQPPNEENEPTEEPETETEQYSYIESIPLSCEEQKLLQAACEEFNVPYALALGLVEKETNFRNLIGDDGASTGYMQVQERWHWDRMERLGVTDLLDPGGNFRVGLDFLSELYNRHEDWGVALTVYNRGHDPGFISNYAYDVLNNYANWQELIGVDD